MLPSCLWSKIDPGAQPDKGMTKENSESVSLMKLDEKVVRKIFATLSQCWKDHSFTMAKFKYSWFVEYMEINKYN